MKLHSTLEIFTSKVDRNGNTYAGIVFTDHETGHSVSGLVGSEGNAILIRLHWQPEVRWDDGIRYTTQTLPIREFNRFFKGSPYAGCLPEEIVAWIKAELKRKSEEKHD